jgi:hypothetical protein
MTPLDLIMWVFAFATCSFLLLLVYVLVRATWELFK